MHTCKIYCGSQIKYVPTRQLTRKVYVKALTTDYDPEVAEEYFSSAPARLTVASRLQTVTSRLGSVSLKLLARYSASRVSLLLPANKDQINENEKLNIMSDKDGEELCKVLLSLGPCFVKLGQTLACRPDLVGDTLANSLSTLQDGAPPYPTSQALLILQREIGQPVDKVFAELSPEPIAAASLGQVYKGKLRSNGLDVAVKVQRPNMLPKIALDVYILRMLLSLVRQLAGVRSDLALLADELGRGLYRELDYQYEARHSREFSELHKHLGFLQVPPVVQELSGERVIVTHWVDGVSSTSLTRENLSFTKEGALSPSALRVLSLVDQGLNATLHQLLFTGMMHADPHGGNMLSLNKLVHGKHAIAYIDFGLVVRVPPQQQQAMMSAIVHIGLGRWDALVEDLDQMDILKPTTERQLLAKDLEIQFYNVLSQDATNAQAQHTSTDELPLATLLRQQTQSTLSFSNIASILIRLAIKYRFKLPPFYTLVVRSLATLEGMALQVSPSFQIVAAAFPYVLSLVMEDQRPGSREIIRELLLSEDGSVRVDVLVQLAAIWAEGQGAGIKRLAASVMEDASPADENTEQSGTGKSDVGAAQGESGNGEAHKKNQVAENNGSQMLSIEESSESLVNLVDDAVVSSGSGIDVRSSIEMAGQLLLSSKASVVRRIIVKDMNFSATVDQLSAPEALPARKLATKFLAAELSTLLRALVVAAARGVVRVLLFWLPSKKTAAERMAKKRAIFLV